MVARQDGDVILVVLRTPAAERDFPSLRPIANMFVIHKTAENRGYIPIEHA